MFKKIIILFSGITLSLICAELVIRKINPQQTFSKSVENSINCYRSHPLIPFTLAKNHRCRMININGEFNTTATINSMGYRGEEFFLEKKPGIKRILMIGDSMTFGWGVSDSETFPYLTGEFLKKAGKNKVEIINAGYKGGLSLDTYYIYLKNEGLKLKPDLVIVDFFIFNDIEDLAANIWVKKDVKGLPEKIESCCHEVDGNILRNKIISFKYRFSVLRDSNLYLSFIGFLQSRFNIFPDRSLLQTKGEQYLGCTLNPDCISKFSDEEKKAIHLLRRMKELTESAGGRFLVNIIPVDYQIYPPAADKYKRYGMRWYLKPGEENFAQKRLAEMLNRENINYFDLLPGFMKVKDEGYPFFPIDAHFNSFGARKASEELGTFLIVKRLID